MPPWQYAVAGLMAIGIMCLCLFPLAPSWLRSVVVYFFLGLIGSIFGLIVVRFFIFLVIFAFVGVTPSLKSAFPVVVRQGECDCSGALDWPQP